MIRSLALVAVAALILGACGSSTTLYPEDSENEGGASFGGFSFSDGVDIMTGAAAAKMAAGAAGSAMEGSIETGADVSGGALRVPTAIPGLDFSQSFNLPDGFDLDDVRQGLVLIENEYWRDARRAAGYYPDLNRFAKEAMNQGITVITLVPPTDASIIEGRIADLGIQHPVVVSEGFRYGLHYLTPQGALEGVSLDRLADRAAELQRAMK